MEGGRPRQLALKSVHNKEASSRRRAGFEALWRVAEHPERYAHRLARRIWSGELNSRSDLPLRLLRPPPPGEDLVGARETLAASRQAAWRALERESSSDAGRGPPARADGGRSSVH